MNIKLLSALLSFSVLLITTTLQINYYKTARTLYQNALKSFNSLRDPTRRSDGTSFIGTIFTEFTLEDLEGRTWRLGEISARLKVIAIFSLNDCAACLQDYQLWNQIKRTYLEDQVFIMGINTGDDPAKIKSFAEARNISFPILQDPTKVIIKSMGFNLSPLRIILDDQNVILNIVLPSGDYTEAKKTLSFIKTYMQGYDDGVATEL